jgi:tetratricopeptide (TPR) repeat protein
LAGLTVSVFAIYVAVQQYRANLALQNINEVAIQGKLDEAAGQVQKAIGLWPQDDHFVLLSNIYLGKADLFLNSRTDPTAVLSAEEQTALKGIVDQAIFAADHACRLDPKKTSNWYNLGSVYGSPITMIMTENASQAALDAYDKAENLYPQSLGVILGRAYVYEVRGEGSEAIEEYQKYLNMIPPNSQEAAAARKKIEQLDQAINASKASAESVSSGTITTPDDITLPTSTAPTSSEKEE